MLKLFGPAESVYVRIVRMVMQEQNVEAELIEFDVFNNADHPEGYAAMHPFSKVPTLVDGKFVLFETSAIVRYLEQQQSTSCLTPADIKYAARMNQAISIMDNYAYSAMVWGLYVAQRECSEEDNSSKRKNIKQAEEKSKKCLRWLSVQLREQSYIVTEGISLADFYWASAMLYFVQTDQGQEALNKHFEVREWWHRIKQRPSVDCYLDNA